MRRRTRLTAPGHDGREERAAPGRSGVSDAGACKCGGARPLGWVARDTPEPELGIALVADLDGNLVELPSSAEAAPRI